MKSPRTSKWTQKRKKPDSEYATEDGSSESVDDTDEEGNASEGGCEDSEEDDQDSEGDIQLVQVVQPERLAADI
jgi:hypothetical protein